MVRLLGEHGASGQVLSWIRQGVRIRFKNGQRPRPYNHGVSMRDATQAQLDFMATELPRFEAIGAWERGHCDRWVSGMFLVPKPGTNKWRLIIDLRELNKSCKTFTMSYETLKHLRHLLARVGGWFVSMDLADGYYALGIREEDRDFFTVNYRGELWRLACLPMGWTGSSYYFCKLTAAFTDYMRTPLKRRDPTLPPTPRPSLLAVSCATLAGGTSGSYPIWTISFSSRTPARQPWSYASG
eukprot:jgi/Tetstr1/441822/TSEL_030038.t1